MLGALQCFVGGKLSPEQRACFRLRGADKAAGPNGLIQAGGPSLSQFLGEKGWGQGWQDYGGEPFYYGWVDFIQTWKIETTDA